MSLERHDGRWLRNRRRVFASLAMAAVLVLVLAACGSSGPHAPGAGVGDALDMPLAPAVRDAPLVSSTGGHLTLGSLQGKVVVISDMMTLCQETCPLDTGAVVQAARAVEKAGLGDKVKFVSITIDPERDTVERLAAYRRLYAPAPANWMLLTGAPRTLSAIWRTLGVYINRTPDTPPAPADWLTGKPLTYDLTHADVVYLIGSSGRERFLLDGAPHLAAGSSAIPAVIDKFMDDEGHDNLTHPQPIAWTPLQLLDAVSWLAGHKISANLLKA